MTNSSKSSKPAVAYKVLGDDFDIVVEKPLTAGVYPVKLVDYFFYENDYGLGLSMDFQFEDKIRNQKFSQSRHNYIFRNLQRQMKWDMDRKYSAKEILNAVKDFNGLFVVVSYPKKEDGTKNFNINFHVDEPKDEGTIQF